MDPCPHCGSGRVATTSTPHLAHHAKLECLDCGRWLRWLPRPRPVGGPVPVEVMSMVHPRRLPAPLCGTDAQCRYARSIRARALHSFAKAGRRDLVDLVRCIVDASWFIANTGRPMGEIRWPGEHQLESPFASGECPNCGDPAYSARACSDECADQLAAYFAIEAEHPG